MPTPVHVTPQAAHNNNNNAYNYYPLPLLHKLLPLPLQCLQLLLPTTATQTDVNISHGGVQSCRGNVVHKHVCIRGNSYGETVAADRAQVPDTGSVVAGLYQVGVLTEMVLNWGGGVLRGVG